VTRYGQQVAFAELLAHPDVVEEQVLASPVGFLALHGGLEPRTAEIATAAAALAGASRYVVVQPEDLKRHVPSHRHDPADAPLLASFLDHVDVVISVHGYRGRGHLEDAILVGGRDRELAVVVADRLRSALPGSPVIDDLDAIPLRLRGLDARNPVNRTARGVQLELPHPVRGVGPYGRGEGADAHRARGAALVTALAELARAHAVVADLDLSAATRLLAQRYRVVDGQSS
jgi:phage replication-related protein YjqB (UPF0714/DUF867 family)